MDRKMVARERAAHSDKAGIGAARQQSFKGRIRSKLVEHNGQQRAQITGYASVTGIPYQMWDMFGEYEEEVANGAFDKTVASNPDVAFLVNHQGLTMARTTNGSLELDSTDRGLKYDAFANPARSDVSDLLAAIDDENITESSFAFMITEGEWSDDYMKFNILEVDIDRGDVSAVNYGANPFTSVAARSQSILRDLEHLPAGAQRAARELLAVKRSATDTTALAQAVDAVIDEMVDLVAGVDLTTLPTDVAQALGLITAAESAVDDLLDSMGVYDPDDSDDGTESKSAVSKSTAGKSALTKPAATGRSVDLIRAMLAVSP